MYYYHGIVSLILHMSVGKRLWKKDLEDVFSLLESGSPCRIFFQVYSVQRAVFSGVSVSCFFSFPEDGPNS